MFSKSEEYYSEQFFKDDHFKHLIDEEFRNYPPEILIAINGIISLQNARIIHLTQEGFVNMTQKMFEDVSKEPKLDIVRQ